VGGEAASLIAQRKARKRAERERQAVKSMKGERGAY